MTYKENLIKVAEIMAAEYFPSNKQDDPEAWEGAVLHKIKFARICLRLQAEALIIWAFGSMQLYLDDAMGKKIMDEKLIGLGLIPVPEVSEEQKNDPSGPKTRSNAQDAILSLMRDGWKLTRLCIQHPECEFTSSVQQVSIKALERKGLIVWTGEQYHLSPSKDQE